jgi:hypothetical protein
MRISIIAISLTTVLSLSACSQLTKPSNTHPNDTWVLIDSFESGRLTEWTKRDTKNETDPYIAKPQITTIETEASGNHFLLKKAAAENIVGNRKALTYRLLPLRVEVGETYTFYTRINVEYFPNNHVFGLSNLMPDQIDLQDYNAFEPSIRITDKLESNGHRNDGTLMVRKGKNYAKILNHSANRDGLPLKENTWYELWYSVNNSVRSDGGQRYDLYVRGGEFKTQQLVFQGADFRMKRELPLIYFLTNCNTGPIDKPYGNGGIRYDDLFMSEGTRLTTPRLSSHRE